ncbi:MAG: AMP-binding protein [Streptosporangiales bacterium]|nr:AMP-binding protein [Streptosporangiales bacterium]MBO0890455.1 AMP-binding protein [Acidothermales bacterium]
MIDLAERTVVHVLEKGAHEHPDKQAIVDRHGRASYAELFDRSLRMAGGLRALGVRAGDAVVLMLDNTVDHALVWFGCSCLNAAEVPLNTGFKAPQIAYVVGHCEAEVIVLEEHYLPLLRAVADELSTVKSVVVRGDPAAAGDLPFAVYALSELAASEPAVPARVRPQDILGILYTSGTTGMPKGVQVTQAQTYGRMLPLGTGASQPDDRTLVVLPIYHVIGQCRGLYNALIAGGTAVLEPKFSASAFWDTCRAHDISYVPLVGVMAGYLLRQPQRPDDRDHPVRHIALGTTSPELADFRSRFGLREVSVSYGLTEVGGVLVGPAEPVGCGYLRPDFEAQLVDEDDVEVPQGETGELVLRPTEPWTVMAGYYKMPEETLRRWRNLWLHTGDLMRRRDDGMYLFVARRAERIRVKGENVSPGDVEAQVAEHPGVAECAVVGVDGGTDATVGEQEVLVALVPRDDADFDPAELVEFLSARLPSFAIPRFVAVLDTLPRTESTHRVRRTELAALGPGVAWDRLAAGKSTSEAGGIR